MSGDLRRMLARLGEGARLGEAEAEEAFGILMSGDATPAQAGAFLMALRVRGETVDEITGAARIMREKVLAVDAPPEAVDTCGTGGDASGTFNISTAAAFVVAGAGVPVAKHGNRALTSQSGSAEVLAALGVNVECGPDRVARCIREAGIGFLMAPRHHGAMRHVAGTRVELGTPTIFNLLGPLSNPAGARRQLMGVFARRWVEPLAHVLGNLGSERAWVVHGSDGLDELTTTGVSHVAELRYGSVRTFDLDPRDIGLAPAAAGDLKGGDAARNAAALRALLDGETGPYRDIVVLNSAAALVVAGRAGTLAEGRDLAIRIIDGGSARERLAELVRLSNMSDGTG